MKDTQGDYKLLETIDSPADMKNLKPEQLIQLSNELRQYIIEIVSSNPGHFGASLGVVELTVALHHIFNAPHDQIVWDVGHQAYGHKILTGRRDVFHTNRKYGVSVDFQNHLKVNTTLLVSATPRLRFQPPLDWLQGMNITKRMTDRWLQSLVMDRSPVEWLTRL